MGTCMGKQPQLIHVFSAVSCVAPYRVDTRLDCLKLFHSHTHTPERQAQNTSFRLPPSFATFASSMDAPEPADTPFAAVQAQTSKYGKIYQSYLDKSTPFIAYRWIGTGVLFIAFGLRIVYAQGWYIVAYSLGIYLLNLFLAFISPKFDPSLEQDQDMEDGVPAGEASSLPTKNDQEFKPFVRRLPEFKFWHAATRAIALAFMCCWSEIFNLPVFWPV